MHSEWSQIWTNARRSFNLLRSRAKKNELIDVSEPFRDEIARISKAPEERLRLDQFCRDGRGDQAPSIITAKRCMLLPDPYAIKSKLLLIA